MVKTWIRRAGIALVALVAAGALALGGAAALSRVVYGRSLYASLYEIKLRRSFRTDRTAEIETARLDALRGSEEPQSPTPTLEGIAVERRESGGMGWFLVNGKADSGVTVFYLHGGAYINRLNRYHWQLIEDLAREAGVRVVAPDYHVAPYGNCARAYEDVPRLYLDYLAENPGERVVMMGDSAGGGLALGVAEWLANEGEPLPERLILLSPWVELSMDNPDIEALVPQDPVLHLDLVKVHGRVWADDLDTHDWRVSPLYGDMAGLPPVTLYAGTRELLYPDLMLLRDKLTAAGVALDFHLGRGLNHEYPLMPVPEGRAAVREIIKTLSGLAGDD